MNSLRRLERTQIREGIETWQMDLGVLPLPMEERPALAAWLLALLHEVTGRYRLTPTVWIEATHIHLEGATRLLAPNARAWRPKTGFGVRPDGEPPRMWTSDDFSGAAFGTTLPIFNNQVFEVSNPAGHVSAIQALAGRGLLTLAAISGTAEQFKAEMLSILGPMVKDRAFHAYPYFFPLLSASSAGHNDIPTWMGSASVYIREMFHDRSLLILSRVSLEPCLEAMRLRQVGEGSWEFERTEVSA